MSDELTPPVADSQVVRVSVNVPKGITITGTDFSDPPLSLTFIVLSSPTHGVLDGAAPDLTYTPDTDYTGLDSFTFNCFNGVSASNTATVSLYVGEFGPGEWGKVSNKCPCECPLPTVEVGYSERVDTGSGFGPWSDYDFTNRAVASKSGDDETQVRARIRITKNGLPAVVRFRQLNSHEDDEPKTIFTLGVTQVISVPNDDSGILEFDYEFIPCADGEAAVLIGAPGRAVVYIAGKTQTASLHASGFLTYTSGFGNPVIYRSEEVLFGGDPGCIMDDRPSRDYFGSQVFSPIAAEAPFWIADPGGLYVSTLSPDLVEDNYASKPFGSALYPDTFGVVEYRETEKDSIERYTCGTVKLEKILNLGLSDLYPIPELQTAVNEALTTQEGLEYTVEVGSTGSLLRQAAMHRYLLSPGNTYYDRIHTSSIRARSDPIDVDTFEGVLVDDTAALDITVTCLSTVRHFDGTDPEESTMTFSARLYGDRGLAGVWCRPGATPDDVGRPDVPPSVNPWGSLGSDTEVIVKSVKAKPNNLICHALLFAEPESVLAEGVD